MIASGYAEHDTRLPSATYTYTVDRYDCRGPRTRLRGLMSIRLLGTLARLALIAGAAALLVSATGLVPGLETQNQETLEAFGDSVKPIFADATVFIESLTTLTFVADEEPASEQLNEDALVQTILSQNDGPSGHTE